MTSMDAAVRIARWTEAPDAIPAPLQKAASALGISPETIQSHVRNAMTKLDADTRTQAVATAIRQALIV